jgi:ribosomal protein L7/L12
VTSFTTLKKAYDKPVDEEAEKFNLELEEEATAYVYSQNELQNLLAAVLAELVPANYELADAEQSLTIANVAASPTASRELTAGILKFTAKVRGYIVPKLEVAKIKKDLAGKSLNEAESYLNSLSGVDAHALTLWPNLPFLQRLPRFPGRLAVSVERK